MTADQLLRGRQAKPRSFGTTGDKRIEHRVLEVRRNAWAVIFDLYRCDDAMSDIANSEVGYCAAAQGNGSVAIKRCGCVANQVQKCLNHLVAIKVDQWKTGVVVPVNRHLALVFRFHYPHHVLEEFMHVHGLFLRRAARAEQRIDKPCKAICFADNNIRVFAQLRIFQLALK